MSAADPRLAAAIAHCAAIAKQHGKSYAFATRLFPRRIREATWALYAFFRLPDEIVDNAQGDAGAELADWRRRWKEALSAGESADPVLHASAWVFRQYQIPDALADAFLDAMAQDLTTSRYASYEELRQYMFGSAAAVGLMMTHVIGVSDRSALAQAERLGYAMQLTNFLRDIDEDFRQRGRIYLPQDEMARFGVSDDDIRERRFAGGMDRLMQFQIERSRRLYAEAERGIPLLAPKGRFPVLLASRLYAAILSKIEKQGRNPFAGRAKTSFPEKTGIALAAVLGSRIS